MIKFILFLSFIYFSSSFFFSQNINKFYITVNDGLHISLSSRYAVNKNNSHSLLFIHGSNAGSWIYEEHWLDYFSENGWDSHAISMRGSNATGTLNNKQFVTIKEHVRDLKEVIDYFSNRKLILLGHSYGGLVMTKLFEDKTYRNKVAGVIWMDSLPPSGLNKIGFRFIFKNKIIRTLRLLFLLLFSDARTEIGRNQLLFYDMCTPRNDVYKYMEMLKNDTYVSLDIMDLRENLPLKRKFTNFNEWKENKNKRFVMSSIGDFLIDSWSLKETANLVKARKPYYFHGPGHNIMLGSRWREGADVILDYLNSEF